MAITPAANDEGGGPGMRPAANDNRAAPCIMGIVHQWAASRREWQRAARLVDEALELCSKLEKRRRGNRLAWKMAGIEFARASARRARERLRVHERRVVFAFQRLGPGQRWW